MIKQLTIHNFQSHKNTIIPFNDGVNVIVGLSDSGKTAILRALNWVINNKPTGDDFRSDWGGDTEVELELSSGYRIVRKRTNSTNDLTVIDPDGNSNNFAAFNRQIPDEVASILNFSEINISHQQESPFLVSSSPGEVAQILNKEAKLEMIDMATSNIRKKVLEVGRKLKNAEELKDQLEEKLLGFADLEKKDLLVSKLEQLQNTRSGLESRKNVVGGILNRLNLLENTLQKPLRLIKAQSALDLISKKARELEILHAQDEDMATVLHSIAKLKPNLIFYENLLGSCDVINYGLHLIGRVQLQKEQLRCLKELYKSHQMLSNELINIDRCLKSTEKEFKQMMPKKCPLCGK